MFESLSLLCTLAHRVAAPRLRYPRANIILKPKFSRKLLFIISCSSSWPPVGTGNWKGKKRISRESSIELLLYLYPRHTYPFPSPFRCFETYRKCRLDGDRKKLRSADITFCVSDGKSPDDGRVVIILRLITIVRVSIWLLQVFLREFTGDVLLKGSLRKKNVAFRVSRMGE